MFELPQTSQLSSGRNKSWRRRCPVVEERDVPPHRQIEKGLMEASESESGGGQRRSGGESC